MKEKFRELELENGGWSLHSHQWFRYSDDRERFCQTDFYLVGPEFIILIESKRSQTENAELQMRELYVPILRAIYKKPVVMLQVFNIATYGYADRKILCPTELCFAPKPGIWYWHYLPT